MPSVILVGGWSWHRHVGDDAILRAHIAELSRHLPHHRPVVVCAEPTRLADRMGVAAVWSAAPALAELLGHLDHAEVTSADAIPAAASVVEAALDGRGARRPELETLVDAIKGADALVAASAGSLTSAYPLTVAEQVVAIRIAQALGKPNIVSGASLGPFEHAADLELLGPALARADLVVLRDATVSPQRAADLGVSPDRLSIDLDPACWMPAGSDDDADVALRRAGLECHAPLGILTVAPWSGGQEQSQPLAEAVDGIAAETAMRFLGIPMYIPPDGGDEPAIDAVRTRSADSGRVVCADPVPADPTLLNLMARADVVVGSRFHGAVMAAMAGTPAVLVHDGAYQRDKARSLAATAPGVTPVPLSAGGNAIAEAAGAALSAQRPSPVRPTHPLPPVAELTRRIASLPHGRLRRAPRLLPVPFQRRAGGRR